jgi:hypothetical protein
MGPADSAAQALADAEHGHVLVSGVRTDFTLDFLEELTVESVTQGVAFGIEVTDALPSGAARRPLGHPSIGLVSGIDHEISAVGCETPADAARAVRQQWAVLGVVAHGDGMHADLGGAVLCGLVAEAETTPAGIVEGGCRTGRCKKEGEIATVVQAGALNCELLVLLSCSSMMLARQLYPSDLSLALAAHARGAAGMVIGTTRQTPQDSEDFWRLIDLLRAGHTVGQAVLELNATRDLEHDGAFVLLGDPRRTIGELPDDSRRSQPAAVAEPAPSGDEAAELLSRLVDTDRLLRAVALIARMNLGSEDPLLTAIAECRRARSLLSESAWSQLAYHRSARALPASVFAQLAERHATWLTAMTGALGQGLLSESHPGAGVGDMLQPALSLWLGRGHRRNAGSRCPHCRGHLFATAYALHTQVDAAPLRIQLDCAACGVTTHRLRRVSGSQSRTSPAALRAVLGHDRLELEMSMGKPRLSLPGRVLVQVRDKSRREPLPPLTYDLAAFRRPVAIPLPGSSSDLYSVRAVALADGGIDFYRCLVAGGLAKAAA